MASNASFGAKGKLMHISNKEIYWNVKLHDKRERVKEHKKMGDKKVKLVNNLVQTFVTVANIVHNDWNIH